MTLFLLWQDKIQRQVCVQQTQDTNIFIGFVSIKTLPLRKKNSKYDLRKSYSLQHFRLAVHSTST